MLHKMSYSGKQMVLQSNYDYSGMNNTYWTHNTSLEFEQRVECI